MMRVSLWKSYSSEQGMKIHKGHMKCQGNLSCDDVQCRDETNKRVSKHGQESNHHSLATHTPNCQTNGQMESARERVIVPSAANIGMWAEIEDEVMGELQSGRKVPLKDRVKFFTQSNYKQFKEKLGIVTWSKQMKPQLPRRHWELERVWVEKITANLWRWVMDAKKGR